MKKFTLSDILVSLQDIAALKQEHFVCFSLDSGQQLIAQRTVFIGTLTSVLAHPREIFADPVADRAAGIIVAHNHPSGDVQPSKQDISMTQQIEAAGLIMGIGLHDHIIVARSRKYFSFREHGFIGLDNLITGKG